MMLRHALIVALCWAAWLLCPVVALNFYYPTFSSSLVDTNLSFLYAGKVDDKDSRIKLTNSEDPFCKDAPVCRGCVVNIMTLYFYQSKTTDAVSFSAIFTFQLTPKAGSGLVFFLMGDPSWDTSDGTGEHFGVFPAGGANAGTTVWAVEFDTNKDTDVNDIDDNHVGINYMSAKSVMAKSAQDVSLQLWGNPITAWIEYNFAGKQLEVRISASNTRPSPAFITMTGYDIRNFVDQEMYMGFAAQGVDQEHQILSWAATSTDNIQAPPTGPDEELSPPPPPPVPYPPYPPPVRTAPALIPRKPSPFKQTPGRGYTIKSPPVKAKDVPALVIAEISGLTILTGLVFVLLLSLTCMRFTGLGQKILWKMWRSLMKITFFKTKIAPLLAHKMCAMICTLPSSSGSGSATSKMKGKQEAQDEEEEEDDEDEDEDEDDEEDEEEEGDEEAVPQVQKK